MVYTYLVNLMVKIMVQVCKISVSHRTVGPLAFFIWV